MRYARINARGQAVDVTTDDPATRYPADFAATFVEVPDDVQNGWTLDGETWVPRAAPTGGEPEQEYLTTISPVAFKLMLTCAERIAIRQAAAYAGEDAGEKTKAAIIGDWWGIVEDVRLQSIDLTSQNMDSALGYLVSVSILTSGRKAEIIKGIPA